MMPTPMQDANSNGQSMIVQGSLVDKPKTSNTVFIRIEAPSVKTQFKGGATINISSY